MKFIDYVLKVIETKVRLVREFKHVFSIFKQHYTYFHIFFHSHIFKKNINNITQTLLLNGLKFLLFT